MTLLPAFAVALLWLGTMAPLPRPSAAMADAGGRIDGRLTNGTIGASPPANLPVILHVFQDQARVGERVATTDDLGNFVFENLEAGPRFVYFPVVEYGGVTYPAPKPIELGDAPAEAVDIRVFEPTEADDTVTFDRANMLILEVAPQSLTVMEMGAVLNKGDRAYVGGAEPDGRRPTLRFSLPSGATQVTPQAGLSANALEGTPDGFISTSPILPGRQELAFSYRIPIASSSLDINRHQELPTSSFNLLVPDTGLTVSSPQLRPLGSNELGGQRYQVYSAQALPRGSQISIRLAGLPSAGAWAQQLGMLIAGSSAATLGVAAFVAVRRRRGTHAKHRTSEQVQGTAGDREHLALVRVLAELDERYSAGEIGADQYRAERQRGKARLVALLAAQPAAQ